MSSVRFEAIYQLSPPISVDSFYEVASTIEGRRWKVTKGGGRRTKGGVDPECQVIINPDGLEHAKIEMLSPVKIKIFSRTLNDIQTCCQNVLAPILYEFLESKGEIKLEFDQLLTYAVTHVPREMLTPIRMKRVAGKGTSYKVEQKAPRGIADDDL
jgi:hypothetical protein